MEFFNGKTIRLKSHLGKYLLAAADERTVRQTSNAFSRNVRWLVDPVGDNSQAIRLRSSNGCHLTASDDVFLLGATGKKVHQTTKNDASTEWEPITEGLKVKLMTKEGKFLRANGGTPPWKNSVTHDLPHRTLTQDWVLWEVEPVDVDFRKDYESSSSRSNSGRRTTSRSTESEKMGRSDSGMEYFKRAKSVRLQSHTGKYLIADEDESTVRQSRNGASSMARWAVEFVDGKRGLIRLKSIHGLYLTAADEAFLLGMTGRKVLQTAPGKATDGAIEWEPVKEGPNIMLMTSEGKFLRANGGGAPPWKNSVTHDVPQITTTQRWVVWGVETLDILVSDMDSGYSSTASSLADDYFGSPNSGSPTVQRGYSSGYITVNQASGMDFFQMAKTVRLKSHHDKYLAADSDEETVIQDRPATSMPVRWTVEFVDDVDTVIRLKSCFGKYLQASDSEFRLGVTGRKVHQSLPRKLDSSIEWEPVRDGMQVKLKTRYGNFLRANGGSRPWRYSITHDIPHRHHDWILWDVDVLEVRTESPKAFKRSDDEWSTSFNFLLIMVSFLMIGSFAFFIWLV